MTAFTPESLVAAIAFGPVLVMGLVFGLVAGLTPGISGRIGLLIALPVALWFDPVSAAVFLIAMHAVVQTSGSVPAVLLGLPTSSSGAATIVDGWPMMQAGRGGEAVGAILASSVVGGVLGGIALLALAPLGGSIARQFTSAEVAALSAAGLLAIAALPGKSLALGLLVAALGVLAATVGVDAYTAVERFTFGRLELWDGLNIGAIVAGLFVIPGLLRDQRAGEGKAVPGQPPSQVRDGDVLAGCRQTVLNVWLVLGSSVIGIVVGFIPGFQRPMVLVIIGLAVVTVMFWLRGNTKRKGAALPEAAEGAEPASNTGFSILLLALFGLATVTAWSLPGQAAVLPVLAGASGLAVTLAALVARRPQRRLANTVTPSVLALFLALLFGLGLVGPPLAAAAFALVYCARFISLPRRLLLPVALGFAAAAWVLAGETIGLLRPLTALSDLFPIPDR